MDRKKARALLESWNQGVIFTEIPEEDMETLQTLKEKEEVAKEKKVSGAPAEALGVQYEADLPHRRWRREQGCPPHDCAIKTELGKLATCALLSLLSWP